MKRQFPALRGLAIILVVLNHAISFTNISARELGYSPAQPWHVTVMVIFGQLGYVAVPIFLFISGGFFAYAARGEPPSISWKVVWSNFKHVLWPYLIWSIIFYVALFFFYQQTFTLFGYIKNIIVGYPYHFIPLLLLYYVLSPIIIWIINRIGPFIPLALIAAYQIMLINLLNPGSLGFEFPTWMGILKPPIVAQTMADWSIYFPLGMVYTLRSKTWTPWLEKFRNLLVVLTIAFFILTVFDATGQINLYIARYLTPFTFALAAATWSRNSIPYVKFFENQGKRAYGIYLIHFIAVNLFILALATWLPAVYQYILILVPIVFLFGLLIPNLLMNLGSRSTFRSVYRYIFG